MEQAQIKELMKEAETLLKEINEKHKRIEAIANDLQIDLSYFIGDDRIDATGYYDDSWYNSNCYEGNGWNDQTPWKPSQIC